MTHLQHLLYVLGAWRFTWYRRWVGGWWRERFIPPVPHESHCGRWRWEQCYEIVFDEHTYGFEQWSRPELPRARLERP